MCVRIFWFSFCLNVNIKILVPASGLFFFFLNVTFTCSWIFFIILKLRPYYSLSAGEVTAKWKSWIIKSWITQRESNAEPQHRLSEGREMSVISGMKGRSLKFEWLKKKRRLDEEIVLLFVFDRSSHPTQTWTNYGLKREFWDWLRWNKT